MSNYFDIIFAILLLYDAFRCFTKKDALNPRLSERYTKESIEKYSLICAFASLIGSIFLIFSGLFKFGVINIGSMSHDKAENLIFISYSCILVLIIAIIVISHSKVLKKLSPDQAAQNPSAAQNEDEDF